MKHPKRMAALYLVLFTLTVWIQAAVAITLDTQVTACNRVPRQETPVILVQTKSQLIGTTDANGSTMVVGTILFTESTTYTPASTTSTLFVDVTVTATSPPRTRTIGIQTVSSTFTAVPTTSSNYVYSSTSTTRPSSGATASSPSSNTSGTATPSGAITIVPKPASNQAAIVAGVVVPVLFILLGVTYWFLRRSSKKRLNVQDGHRQSIWLSKIWSPHPYPSAPSTAVSHYGPPAPPMPYRTASRSAKPPTRPQRPPSLSESIIDAMRSPQRGSYLYETEPDCPTGTRPFMEPEYPISSDELRARYGGSKRYYDEVLGRKLPVDQSDNLEDIDRQLSPEPLRIIKNSNTDEDNQHNAPAQGSNSPFANHSIGSPAELESGVSHAPVQPGTVAANEYRKMVQHEYTLARLEGRIPLNVKPEPVRPEVWRAASSVYSRDESGTASGSNIMARFLSDRDSVARPRDGTPF